MNSVAFFTVFYPSAEKFITDFIYSINNQTNQNFDLLIMNDGIKNIDIHKSKINAKTIILDCKNKSFSEIREIGIEYLKTNYDYAIFGDADDYFSENRISNTIELFKKNDVIINELNLVKENNESLISNYISRRIKNKTKLGFSFFHDKNIAGFTNTSIKLSCLSGLNKIPENITAIDWFVFSFAIINSKSTIFTNEITTFYRQHLNNIIGIGEVNKSKILTTIKAKINHYKSISKVLKLEIQLRKEIQQKISLLSNIIKDDIKIKIYLKNINDKKKTYFWWEVI